MLIVNPRSFSIQQCSFFLEGMGKIPEEKKKYTPHIPLQEFYKKDTKSTMNISVSGSKGKKGKPHALYFRGSHHL